MGCDCGTSYSGNECAHTLTNGMIENGTIGAFHGGMAKDRYCPKGRLIAAFEVREHVFRDKFSVSRNPPKDNKGREVDCYIYCEDNVTHKKHVFYGTRNNCVLGTMPVPSNWTDVYVEYYQ